MSDQKIRYMIDRFVTAGLWAAGLAVLTFLTCTFVELVWGDKLVTLPVLPYIPLIPSCVALGLCAIAVALMIVRLVGLVTHLIHRD